MKHEACSVCFITFINRLWNQILILFISIYSQYINMRTQKISVVLNKRFTTPNWVKVSRTYSEVGVHYPSRPMWMVCANVSLPFLFVQHKEPREVHMFVDLLLQEVNLGFIFFSRSKNGKLKCSVGENLHPRNYVIDYTSSRRKDMK